MHTKIISSQRKVKELGQVFTPDFVVRFMLGLRRNEGRTLEPSCGAGYFSDHIKNCIAIELDKGVCPSYAKNIDFFAYPDAESFNTIIGNPPYVRHQDILATTKRLLDFRLFDARANLYLFFIEKCLRHLRNKGEMILITPRDFLKATSSRKLNKKILGEGTVTHLVDLGDLKVFDDATPNCIIWRFVKGDFSLKTSYFNAATMTDARFLHLQTVKWEERKFVEIGGHLSFPGSDHSLRLNTLFFVKVGAVSGADEVFAHSKHGNQDFVCSETAKTKKLRKMIYKKKSKYLLQFKDRLISRRIKQFDESNWWEWGRDCFHSTMPRIYVNTKTRTPQPFFLNDCNYYDGSVLAIFPRNPDVDIELACELLNKVDWEEQGFVCDGRFLFGQRSLENAVLPSHFSTCLKKKSRKAA